MRIFLHFDKGSSKLSFRNNLFSLNTVMNFKCVLCLLYEQLLGDL